jgi:hypothetical protein
MNIETLKVLVISTAHITKEDGKQLEGRSYVPGEKPTTYITPATDEYGHWLWAGDCTDAGSCEERCATAEDEGYSSYFTDVLRFAQKNQCTYIRFDVDGPKYKGLGVLKW